GPTGYATGAAGQPGTAPTGSAGGTGSLGRSGGAGGAGHPGGAGSAGDLTRLGNRRIGDPEFGRWSGGPQEPPAAHDVPTHPGDLHAPRTERRRTGLGAWARRLAGGSRVPARPEDVAEWEADQVDPVELARDAVRAADALDRRWPDPAAVLLSALGPDVRLWDRTPCHPDALVVRLGTADQPVTALAAAGAP
ncbi:cell division protein FtsK, partial [Streptomyces sp. HSW2009]